MKYGLLLATRQLGWKSTPEVAVDLWRRLRNRMATCDLDVANDVPNMAKTELAGQVEMVLGGTIRGGSVTCSAAPRLPSSRTPSVGLATEGVA